MTESTNPNLFDLIQQVPMGTSFEFGIYSTELYQSGRADTGFYFPQICSGNNVPF
jgi:hypothetical protein